MYTNIKLFIIVFICLLLAGCKAAPVYNVQNKEFTAASHISLYQIGKAILKGCKRAGWQARLITPGKILASYGIKKNKFQAMVDIDYNRHAYNISYRSSKNLKYKIRTTSQQSPSSNLLTEYNPFTDTDKKQGNANLPQATIHKIYNQWVSQLEDQINLSLLQLTTASGSNRTLRGSVASPATLSECHDTPLKLLNGQASVVRSSVNLRQGASTRCAVVGSVKRQETFDLLGQKGNWYQIRNAQNKIAWIYAPLVKRLPQNQKIPNTQNARLQSPPPPPAIPKKKISIAVIEFKTLNKEAQDIALGELISETFTSSLVNSSAFKIIEREQLDKVIKEMEMNQTGFIETTDAVEIGKMLHADAIITGSVALLAGQIQLNARIIDIESAYVISAESRTSRYSLQKIKTLVDEIVYKLSSGLQRTR